MGYVLAQSVLAGDVRTTVRMLTFAPPPILDVNRQFDGRGYLHQAATFGNLDMLKLLLKQPGIDVNIETYKGFSPITPGLTPLYVAASYSQVYNTTKFVCHLVHDPRVLINERIDDGSTALSYAVESGGVDAAKCIIATGQILNMTGVNLSEDSTLDCNLKFTDSEYTYLGTAMVHRKMCNRRYIQQLLLEYQADRDTVIARVRADLDWK